MKFCDTTADIGACFQTDRILEYGWIDRYGSWNSYLDILSILDILKLKTNWELESQSYHYFPEKDTGKFCQKITTDNLSNFLKQI